MKLLILSDLQGVDYDSWQLFLNKDYKGVEAVFLLGDIEPYYLKTIKERFMELPIFGVHGNHDTYGDLERHGITNVHDQRVWLNNYSIIGLEGSMRYKKGNAPLYTEEEVLKITRYFPHVDIILSHNSPKDVHDQPDLAHQGFEGLTRYILNKKPIFHFHGHQHKNHASFLNQTLIIGIHGGVIFDTEERKLSMVLKIAA